MAQFLERAWELLTRRVDSFLFGVALSIAGVGLITLFSASDQSVARLTSQAANLAFALVLMWIVANVSPQTLARAAVPLYTLAVVMLICVALFGTMVNGSRRWLNLGFARFQPSELMKIALPLMLAWYFQKFGAASAGRFHAASWLITVPVYLLKRQPDLGVAADRRLGFYVLDLALSGKVIVGLVVVASAAARGLAAAPGYQLERIMTFIEPTRDPLGRVQTSQAVDRAGIGGPGRQRRLNGTQPHLDFLPERHHSRLHLAVFARSSADRHSRMLFYMR